jgi:hypothetical protein
LRLEDPRRLDAAVRLVIHDEPRGLHLGLPMACSSCVWVPYVRAGGRVPATSLGASVGTPILALMGSSRLSHVLVQASSRRSPSNRTARSRGESPTRTCDRARSWSAGRLVLTGVRRPGARHRSGDGTRDRLSAGPYVDNGG